MLARPLASDKDYDFAMSISTGHPLRSSVQCFNRYLNLLGLGAFVQRLEKSMTCATAEEYLQQNDTSELRGWG